jgi:hypothetical protein
VQNPTPEADGIVGIVVVGGLCCLVSGIAPGWYIWTGGVEGGGKGGIRATRIFSALSCRPTSSIEHDREVMGLSVNLMPVAAMCLSVRRAGSVQVE